MISNRYGERDLEGLEQVVALTLFVLHLKKIREMLQRTALELPATLRMQREVLAEKQQMLARAMKALQVAEQALQPGKPEAPRS